MSQPVEAGALSKAESTNILLVSLQEFSHVHYITYVQLHIVRCKGMLH